MRGASRGELMGVAASLGGERDSGRRGSTGDEDKETGQKVLLEQRRGSMRRHAARASDGAASAGSVRPKGATWPHGDRESDA